MRTTRNDLTNQTFGHLTVIGPRRSVTYGKAGRFKSEWFCHCTCGKEVWRQADALIQGQSDSCGCQRIVRTVAKIHKAHKAAGIANRKHGYSGNKNPLRRLYTIWSHMKDRCDNPKTTGFIHYGGRGISYYPAWKDFEPFRDWALTNGYTESLTLERNNVNGNYEPSNCSFKTRKQQTDNTRRTIWLTPTLTISAFSEAHNIPYDLAWHTYKLKAKYPEVFIKLMQVLDNQLK